jgi:hypothetical protein
MPAPPASRRFGFKQFMRIGIANVGNAAARLDDD